MMKPGRIGRPPNQPTNHTIYGSWEGAHVLLLDLCGLPDPPYMGARSLPTIFSAHVTIVSATQPCTPPSACVRRTDPSPFLLFSTLSLTFDKSSKRISPSRSKRPARARFQATDALFSHLEHSSRVRSRISQGRLSVTRLLLPGKFSGRAGPDNQPTNLIGVTSRYLEHPLTR